MEGKFNNCCNSLNGRVDFVDDCLDRGCNTLLCEWKVDQNQSAIEQYKKMEKVNAIIEKEVQR